jgi:putative ABC transport system permease protein
VTGVFQDFRFAFRSLRKHPSFFAMAVLTLALGIGVNSAMFAIFDAILLQPLPFRDGKRMVVVWQRRAGGQPAYADFRSYREWKNQARSIEHLQAVGVGNTNVTGAGDAVQVMTGHVTEGFFTRLGVRAALGRVFAAGEDRQGGSQVAVISQHFWRTQFGADPNALGRSIRLDGRTYIVTGILPPDFLFLWRGVEIWMPMNLAENFESRHNLFVLGYLAGTSSLQQAREEMEVIGARLAKQYPDSHSGWGVTVLPFREAWVGELRPALLAFLGAVALLLLLAAANIANLLLARASARHQEIGVRVALGAGPGVLLRQLITESLMLGCFGGGVGLLLAYGGVRLAAVLQTGKIPRIEDASIDIRVLAFTIAISVFTSLLFGLFPARQLLKADVVSSLRESTRGSSASKAGKHARRILVISEIALSVILLAGAGVLIRSFGALQHAERGFQPAHLLSFRLNLPSSRYREPAQMLAFHRALMERLNSSPGVQGATSTTNLPLDGLQQTGLYFAVEGAAQVPDAQRPSAKTNLIDTAYFRTLGLPIVSGRPFNERDRGGAPAVAVVSESLAKRFWPAASAVGRHITVRSLTGEEAYETREIVGVAHDVSYPTKSLGSSIEIYLPYEQSPFPALYVLVHSQLDKQAVTREIQAGLRKVDPAQSIADVSTLVERLESVNEKSRWNSSLGGVFAALAALLAAVGIYSVVAYTTAQRTQEIGIRIALGARNWDVMRWLLRDAAWLIAIGLALGLAGYLGVARVLRSLVFGAGPLDPTAVVSAAFLVGSIALAASWIPALRALRIDPVRALRAE